jgi:hypothetical protein
MSHLEKINNMSLFTVYLNVLKKCYNIKDLYDYYLDSTVIKCLLTHRTNTAFEIYACSDT